MEKTHNSQVLSVQRSVRVNPCLFLAQEILATISGLRHPFLVSLHATFNTAQRDGTAAVVCTHFIA